jgi:VanZ family protein
LSIAPRPSEAKAEAEAGQRHASPLARALLTVYAALVMTASLMPWSGWRDLGVSPWAYLTAPIPLHVTPFDVIINVLGYLPFGALAVLAAYPRFTRARAVLLAVAGAALQSAGVEAVQTWLPARVASNLDLAANMTGAALGAALMAPWCGGLIDRGRIAQWRAGWFAPDTAGGLVLVGVWTALQVEPTPMLFESGALPGAADTAGAVLSLLGGADPAAPRIARLAPLAPATYVLAEAAVVTAGLLAAGVLLAAVMRARAPRVPLLMGLLATALGVRTLSYGTLFGADRALLWLTPGAWAGLAVGTVALLLLASTPRRVRLVVALCAAGALLAIVNAVPTNPYHLAWRQTWQPGRLLHFSALAETVGAVWPLALIAWAVAQLARNPARNPSSRAAATARDA